MSEATRRVPREISATATVASNLAEFASVFMTDVDGEPVAVAPQYAAGHVCDERDARALSWAYVDRASSTAFSEITRGSKKDLSSDDKRAYLKEYLNGGYKFTDKLGNTTFAQNLLEQAAHRLFFEMGVEMGEWPSDKETAKTLAKNDDVIKSVTKMLHDPSVCEKYLAPIRATCEKILGEKVTGQTRTKKPTLNIGAVKV